MYPAVATGAHNPANGMVSATLGTDSFDYNAGSPPPQAVNDDRFDGAEVLANQILDTVARCRALGHREPRISLTRPTETLEGVRDRLLRAGLAPVMRSSSVGGLSVLSLRW